MQTLIGGLESYRNAVYPWQCDSMGHMNTQFYAAAFDAAGFGILSRVAPMRMLLPMGLGWADIRQVIEYRHEVVAGTVIVIRSSLSALGGSSITILHTMTDDSGATIHATSETKTVLFDLKKRKAARIEGELRDRASAIPATGDADGTASPNPQ